MTAAPHPARFRKFRRLTREGRAEGGVRSASDISFSDHSWERRKEVRANAEQAGGGAARECGEDAVLGTGSQGESGLLGSVSDMSDSVARGPAEREAQRAKLPSRQRHRVCEGPAVTPRRWQMACNGPAEGVRMSSRVTGV